MKVTLDTNVLIYAYDNRDPAKRECAIEIARVVGAHAGRCMALQVIGEFYTVATRRLKMSGADAATQCAALHTHFPTFGYDQEHVTIALQAAAEGHFSYWDGLLLASAVSADCNIFVSEDLQDRFRYNDLEVMSPFAAEGTPNPVLMDRLAN